MLYKQRLLQKENFLRLNVKLSELSVILETKNRFHLSRYTRIFSDLGGYKVSNYSQMEGKIINLIGVSIVILNSSRIS